MSEVATQPLDPTPRQVDYARQLAAKLNVAIPWESARDRVALSAWISARRAEIGAGRAERHHYGATSKQVEFAERIARRKRQVVPEECFRDAGLMSRWIDSNRSAL